MNDILRLSRISPREGKNKGMPGFPLISYLTSYLAFLLWEYKEIITWKGSEFYLAYNKP